MRRDARAERMSDAEAVGVLGVAQERLRQEQAGREAARAGPVAGSTVPGRPLSEYRPENLEWFWRPYIPRGMLTLVVGESNTGKSSLMAWLVAQATTTILLPGFEENFRVKTLPRLLLYDIQLDNVRVLDEGTWRLPECRGQLTDAALALQADLIVFDPISSYLASTMSPNDPQAVRAALEAAASVAITTGAAVVGVRHPGKAAANVMMGAVEWTNVPQAIVQLVIDHGPPLRRLIRLHKDGLGMGQCVREYHLQGGQGEPKRFELAAQVSEDEAALIGHLADDLERTRFGHAQALLRDALRLNPQPSRAVYALGDAERISERTLFRAAQSLGVVMTREGSGADHRCMWSLPGPRATPATPATHGDTPPLNTHTGGVSPGHGGSDGSAPPEPEPPPQPQPEAEPPPPPQPKSRAKRPRKSRARKGGGRGA